MQALWSEYHVSIPHSCTLIMYLQLLQQMHNLARNLPSLNEPHQYGAVKSPKNKNQEKH